MWVALKRAGCCAVAFDGSVNCACVSQRFQQLINNMLYLAFLRKFVCQPFLLCSSSNTNFYQNLVFVAEYHVDC